MNASFDHNPEEKIVYTLVTYYSFSGRTHYEAKRMAEAVEGELYEVREQKLRHKHERIR